MASRVPIRPMPNVYFLGRFRLCDGKRCRGQKCTFAHSAEEQDAWNTQKGLGVRVTEGALPSLLHLLSPVAHSWGLFAWQIGVPTAKISQIQAANPPTYHKSLYTSLTQALEWWTVHHHSPTYEVIISALDPKLGETTPVMNRALASQVREFMAKEQEKEFKLKKKLTHKRLHLRPQLPTPPQIPFEPDTSADSFPPLTPQSVVPSQSMMSPPTPSFVQVLTGKHHALGTPSLNYPKGGTGHETLPLKPLLECTGPVEGKLLETPFPELSARDIHELPILKKQLSKSNTPDTQMYTFFPRKHTPVETKWPDLEAHSSKPITKMSERPSIQTPTSDYSTMETTFRERLAEPAPIEEKLERSNYQEKFHKLLFSEEKEHIQVLQKRCKGFYRLVLHQAGLKPPNIFNMKPYHKRFGYLCVLNDDKIACATQASEGVVIVHEGHKIRAEILRDNFFHREQRLYIAFDKKNVDMLETYLSLPRSSFVKELNVDFELKHSYFNNLHKAVNQLSPKVIARLIPEKCDFVKVHIQRGTISKRYKNVLKLSECSYDQWWALQMMLSCPSHGPPVLISGPFGTGKTRILAIAVHSFFEQSKNTAQPARILVCTQQHTSADTFLDFYTNIDQTRRNVYIVRLVDNRRYRNPMRKWVVTLDNLVKTLQRNPRLNQSRLLIVTTCLTSFHLTKTFPPGFFTHILLDEGALMREPEGIAPLAMAGSNTKVVIAGDKNQVGPTTLVLGEEARENGLAISLLERLQQLYKDIGEAANDYHATLVTNYRCHPKILTITEVHYELPLKSYHSDESFPLLFVCSSIEAEQNGDADSGRNELEVRITLEEINRLSKQWPTGWDVTKVGFLSPKRSQVTTFRSLIKTRSYKHLKGVQSLPTYTIQGCEFQAVFLSTSESLLANDEPFDPTKSLSNPYVFNTAVSRAKSLVVSVGNPFTLLRVERYMIQKFGKKGTCWSRYLKACLDNAALSFGPSVRISKAEEQGYLRQLKMKLIENQLLAGSFDTSGTATAHSKSRCIQPLPVGLKTQLEVRCSSDYSSMVSSPDGSVTGQIPYAQKSESGDSGMQSRSTSESGSTANLSFLAEPAQTYHSVDKTPQSQSRMLLENLEKMNKMLIATTDIDPKRIEKLRKEVDAALQIRDELEIGLTSKQKELQDSIHLTAALESQREMIKEAKERLDDDVEMLQSQFQDEIQNLKWANSSLATELEASKFHYTSQIHELWRVRTKLEAQNAELHKVIGRYVTLEEKLREQEKALEEKKREQEIALEEKWREQEKALEEKKRELQEIEEKLREQEKVLEDKKRELREQEKALEEKKREQEITLEEERRKQEESFEEERRKQEKALNELRLQMKTDVQEPEKPDGIRETVQVVHEAPQLESEEKIQNCRDGATPNKTSVTSHLEPCESQSDENTDDTSADELETTDSYSSDEETADESRETESGQLPLADAFNFVQKSPHEHVQLIEEIDFLPLALSLYKEKVVKFTEIDTFIQPRTVYTAQQKFQKLICHIHVYYTRKSPQEAAETLWKIMHKNHLQSLMSEIDHFRKTHGQLTDSDFEEKVEEFLKHSSTSPENVQDGNERISSPPTRIHHGTGFLKSLPEDSCAKHESSKRKQSTTTSIPKPSELPYHDYLAKFDELFQNGFAVENTVANAIMSSGRDVVEGVDLGTKLMTVHAGSDRKKELRPCIKVLTNIEVDDVMKSAIGKEIIQAVNSKYGKHFPSDDYKKWLEWLDFTSFEIPTGAAKPLGKKLHPGPGIQFDSQATSQNNPDRSGTLGIMIRSQITVQGEKFGRHYGLSCAHCILSTAACGKILKLDKEEEEDFEQWNRVQLHESRQVYSVVPQGGSLPRLDIAQCNCRSKCQCSENEYKSLSLASLYPAKFAPRIRKLMQYSFKSDQLAKYAGLTYGWFPSTQALVRPEQLHANQTDTHEQLAGPLELTPKYDSQLNSPPDETSEQAPVQKNGSDAEQSSGQTVPSHFETKKKSTIQFNSTGKTDPQGQLADPLTETLKYDSQLNSPPDETSDQAPVQKNGSDAEQNSGQTVPSHFETEKKSPIQFNSTGKTNPQEQLAVPLTETLKYDSQLNSPPDETSDQAPVQKNGSDAEQSSGQTVPSHFETEKKSPIQFNSTGKTDPQEQLAVPLTETLKYDSQLNSPPDETSDQASVQKNGSNAEHSSGQTVPSHFETEKKSPIQFNSHGKTNPQEQLAVPLTETHKYDSQLNSSVGETSDQAPVQKNGTDEEQNSGQTVPSHFETEKKSPIQFNSTGKTDPQEQLAVPLTETLKYDSQLNSPPDETSDQASVQKNGSNAEHSSGQTVPSHFETEKKSPIQFNSTGKTNPQEQLAVPLTETLKYDSQLNSPPDETSDQAPVQKNGSDAEQSFCQTFPNHLEREKNNPTPLNSTGKTNPQEQLAVPLKETLKYDSQLDSSTSETSDQAPVQKNGTNEEQSSDEASFKHNDREKNVLPYQTLQENIRLPSDPEQDSCLEQDTLQENHTIVQSPNTTAGDTRQQQSTCPFPLLRIPFRPRARIPRDDKRFTSRCNIDAGAVSLTHQKGKCALQMQVGLSDIKKWKTAQKFTDILPSAPISGALHVYRYAFSSQNAQQASGSLCLARPGFQYDRAKLKTAHIFSFSQNEKCCFIKDGDSGSVVYTLDRKTETATVFGMVYAMTSQNPFESDNTAGATSSICHAFSLTNALELLRPQLNYSSAKKLQQKYVQSDSDKKSVLEKYMQSFETAEELKKTAIRKLNGCVSSNQDEEKRSTVRECVWKYLNESYCRQCNYPPELEGWIPELEFKLEPCVSGCGEP